MDNNDILRKLRYALNIKDSTIVDIFSFVNYEIKENEVISLLRKEDANDFLECDNKTMESFLDGLIIYKRGKKEINTRTNIDNIKTESSEQMYINKNKFLTNNIILKKIRIALNLREEDILEIFNLAKFYVSKSEINAIFRNPKHRNYKECGDQFLRNFLKGLNKY